jgi:hypothetical protein
VGRVFLPRLVSAARAAVRPSAGRSASTHHIKVDSFFFQVNKTDPLPAARRPVAAEEERRDLAALDVAWKSLELIFVLSVRSKGGCVRGG